MTYSRSQAQEYILQSRGVLSLISLTNSSYSYADWKRAIRAFEHISKAIEADPYLADAYFVRALCSQLFMNMVSLGSQFIQQYADQHISLEKGNTFIQDFIKAEELGSQQSVLNKCAISFIQDLIKAEELGSSEARFLLYNDPLVAQIRTIYDNRNSSSKTPKNNNVEPNSQTINSQTTNSSQGDCFIATAAYSNTEHPDIDTFRKFRDTVLLTSFFGRFLVAGYYKIGPILAKYVKNNKNIQMMCRNLLSNLAEFLRKN